MWGGFFLCSWYNGDMAQYKVPQDVEADDKLLGPFTFRQFIYLLIVAGFIALAVALFQVFPALVIIPVPVVLFFGVLALPIKKDQPMETYLSAIVSYYLKPRTRMWDAGQAESTILITAPKKVEEARTKDLSQEEATHRLSFLAEIVDSEGYAIKGATTSPIREEIRAEAMAAVDMFEAVEGERIERTLETETEARHEELVNQMRAAIEKAGNGNLAGEVPTIQKFEAPKAPMSLPTDDPVMRASPTVTVPMEGVVPTIAPTIMPLAEPNLTDSTIVQAVPSAAESVIIQPMDEPGEAEKEESTSEETPTADIISLANNTEFSIETIAKEAKRLGQKKQDDEVYVSLH